MKTQAGLTLIEVLIAAVVLGVGILGVAGAFPSAFRQVSDGGQMTKATGLAHQMMEDIRSDPPYYIPRYAGKNGQGVATEGPANFPDDAPWSCTAGILWGDQFCGNTKLNRWQQDLTRDCPDDACRARLAASEDGRPLANGRGTVTVVDHENPVPAGGGAVSGNTVMLRITVTVSWEQMTGRRQVQLVSTVPCARPGCG